MAYVWLYEVYDVLTQDENKSCSVNYLICAICVQMMIVMCLLI